MEGEYPFYGNETGFKREKVRCDQPFRLMEKVLMKKLESTKFKFTDQTLLIEIVFAFLAGVICVMFMMMKDLPCKWGKKNNQEKARQDFFNHQSFTDIILTKSNVKISN